MKRVLFVLFSVLCFYHSAYSQYKYDWIKDFYSTCYGPDGSVYTIEDYGSVYEYDLDPLLATTAYPATNIQRDIFAAKYDTAGNLHWIKSIPFAGDQYVEYSTVGRNNQVYVYGKFTDSVNVSFDPLSPHILNRAGSSMFIAIYDSSMQLISSSAMPDLIAGGFILRSIVTETNNPGCDFYLAGSLTGSVDFDFTGATSLVNSNQEDFLIARYSESTALIWANSYGTVAGENLKSISIGAQNNVLVAGQLSTGNFSGLDTFMLGPDTYYLPPFTPHSLALQINSSGTILNSWMAGGSAVATGISQKDSLIFISGSYNTAIDFNMDAVTDLSTFSGDVNGYVIRLDSSMNYQMNFEWSEPLEGILLNPSDGSITTFQHGLLSMAILWLDDTLGTIQNKSYNSTAYTNLKFTYSNNGDLYYNGGGYPNSTIYETGTIPLSGVTGTFKLSQNCYPATFTGLLDDTVVLCASILYPGSTLMGLNATGSGLRFQWYSDTMATVDVNNPPLYVAGSNQSSLALGMTTAAFNQIEYYCMIEDNCGNIILSDTVVFLLYHQPDDFEYVFETIDTLSGIDLTITSPGTYNPIYMWKKGSFVLYDNTKFTGTSTNQLTIHNLDVNDQGTYECLVANSACDETYFPLYNQVIVTLEDIGLEDYYFGTMLFYPNPTTDNIYLKAEKPGKINRSVIANSVGQIISETNYAEDQINYSWDVNSLHPGIYFVTIWSNQYSKTFQFIKQ